MKAIFNNMKLSISLNEDATSRMAVVDYIILYETFAHLLGFLFKGVYPQDDENWEEIAKYCYYYCEYSTKNCRFVLIVLGGALCCHEMPIEDSKGKEGAEAGPDEGGNHHDQVLVEYLYQLELTLLISS